ncbi:hypothetical protein QBC39DRAFT_120588 [Podospora conica]|nr:hypothetical protein QBC39DRAFT_120588 [Schizothecium conicum]
MYASGALFVFYSNFLWDRGHGKFLAPCRLSSNRKPMRADGTRLLIHRTNLSPVDTGLSVGAQCHPLAVTGYEERHSRHWNGAVSRIGPAGGGGRPPMPSIAWPSRVGPRVFDRTIRESDTPTTSPGLNDSSNSSLKIPSLPLQRRPRGSPGVWCPGSGALRVYLAPFLGPPLYHCQGHRGLVLHPYPGIRHLPKPPRPTLSSLQFKKAPTRATFSRAPSSSECLLRCKLRAHVRIKTGPWTWRSTRILPPSCLLFSPCIAKSPSSDGQFPSKLLPSLYQVPLSSLRWIDHGDTNITITPLPPTVQRFSLCTPKDPWICPSLGAPVPEPDLPGYTGAPEDSIEYKAWRWWAASSCGRATPVDNHPSSSVCSHVLGQEHVAAVPLCRQ